MLISLGYIVKYGLTLKNKQTRKDEVRRKKWGTEKGKEGGEIREFHRSYDFFLSFIAMCSFMRKPARYHLPRE